MRFLLAENECILVQHECILVQHECKVVTLVQNTNSTRTLSKFRLFWLSAMFFPVHYYLEITWFLLQFGVNKQF